jgi:hypothetical protein
VDLVDLVVWVVVERQGYHCRLLEVRVWPVAPQTVAVVAHQYLAVVVERPQAGLMVAAVVVIVAAVLLQPLVMLVLLALLSLSIKRKT